MTDQLTAIFVFMDDVLTAMRGPHRPEDSRRQNSDAEVLTTALAAALFFGGNQERARVWLKGNGMVPEMLGKSRFCRRLHALSGVLESVFLRLGAALKAAGLSTRYAVDSFPVARCDNIRIRRCKLVQNESFRGKLASKRRFFYGVRVHVVVTEAGRPVEFALLPGSASDQRGLDVRPLNLPAGAELYADAAFTCYWLEDALRERGELDLQVCYRANSLRRQSPALGGFKTLMRRGIESTFSAITRLLGHHVHAVSFAGFQIKLALCLLAFNLPVRVEEHDNDPTPVPASTPPPTSSPVNPIITTPANGNSEHGPAVPVPPVAVDHPSPIIITPIINPSPERNLTPMPNGTHSNSSSITNGNGHHPPSARPGPIRRCPGEQSRCPRRRGPGLHAGPKQRSLCLLRSHRGQ